MAEPVTRQAIDQRFTPAAVDFLKACFTHILAQTLTWCPTLLHAQLLGAHFTKVYLLDSTSFDCSKSLKDIFPSCGGDGSQANIKVLLRYEVTSGTLEPLSILGGKRCDQGQSLKAAERLSKGQLQIQDKGFYDAKAWKAAQDRGAYLLMPLPHSTHIELSTVSKGEEKQLNLASVLKASQENRLEWTDLILGTKNKIRGIRLVAFRLTPESASRRRQGLRESMRKRNKAPSAQALELIGWALLLTNAPAQKLPSKVMSFLYRLRWQIELIFRQMKTSLRINESESDNPWRVQSELWARLMSAVLLFLWHAQANAQCWRLYQREASFEKLIGMMRQWGHTIARAFLSTPAMLLEKLRELWKQILRNGRKETQKSRHTTWENLVENWLGADATAR